MSKYVEWCSDLQRCVQGNIEVVGISYLAVTFPARDCVVGRW